VLTGRLVPVTWIDWPACVQPGPQPRTSFCPFGSAKLSCHLPAPEPATVTAVDTWPFEALRIVYPTVQVRGGELAFGTASA
jgi:hypothetical protein